MTQEDIAAADDAGSRFGLARFFLAQVEFPLREKKLRNLVANLSTIIDGFTLEHDTYLDAVVALEALLADVLGELADPYSRLTCQGSPPTSSVARQAGVAAVTQKLFSDAKLCKKTRMGKKDSTIPFKFGGCKSDCRRS